MIPKYVLPWGFIKSTDHRTNDHRPSNQTTTNHLPNDPTTQRIDNHI